VSETVAVLGPGAVGAAVAVPLALAGVEVVCVARPATAEAIRSGGLCLRRGSDDLVARVRVAVELRKPVDLLLVTVKAPSLEEALSRVHAPVAVTIPLLNGIEHMRTLRERISGEVVAGSIGRIEAFLERPGLVIQPTPSVVMTVASDAEPGVVALLRRSGVDVHVNGSEAEVLWEKLARQAATAAATSITQRPIGELRADAEWRARLRSGIAEACAVAAQDGVTLSIDAEWEIIEAMPPLLTSSTARDIAAGVPSELDAITGATVRAGRRVGVETPELLRMLSEANEACRPLSR
jgi:2-dehydropantoate 2-reductase